MDAVYYRGCLLKGVSFIADLYKRAVFLEGVYKNGYHLWVESFEGVSTTGVFIKGFVFYMGN